MPTKRRKLAPQRIGVMTDAQRFHLICGRYFFDYAGEADHFRDDAHRRATWAAHREQILAEWDHPGERPIALWAYDFGLKPAPYPKLWSWPRPIRTEAEAVYRLIERGELAPCRFNGTVPIASELQEIASRWELLIRCPHLGYSGEVPAWFRRRHGKRILAEQAADVARGRSAAAMVRRLLRQGKLAPLSGETGHG